MSDSSPNPNFKVFAHNDPSSAFTYTATRPGDHDIKSFILEDNAAYYSDQPPWHPGPRGLEGLNQHRISYLVHRDNRALLISGMDPTHKREYPIIAVRLDGEVIPDHDMVIEFLFDAGIIGGKYFAHVESVPVLRTYASPDDRREERDHPYFGQPIRQMESHGI